MNYMDTLKEKLKNQDKLYSTMLCHIGFTGLPAIYKAGGMDFLVMDCEHGSFCPENIGDFNSGICSFAYIASQYSRQQFECYLHMTPDQVILFQG